MQHSHRFAMYALTTALVTGAVVQVLSQQSSTVRTSAAFEPEIATFERRDRSNPPPQGAFLFIGSSSLRLWKALESAFPGKSVINRGFGGSELRDSTYFADRVISPYHPRMVLLYAGDNDIASGRTPDQVLEDFKQFVSKVRGSLPHAKIAFISIKPSPSRWKLVSQTRMANSKVHDYIRRQKNLVYINVFDAMIGPDGQPIPEYYREDKLHPTEAAYAAWQKIIAPFLK